MEQKTYAEGLDIIDRDGIAVEVEEGILEHAAMTVAVHVSMLPATLCKLGHLRKHEAVTVHPIGVLGVEAHNAVEQDVGDRRHAPAFVSSRSGIGGQSGDVFI